MGIEDFNSQRYKELGQISAREQEKARLIEEITNKFEKGLIDIITTRKRQVDLYSRDFVEQKDPILVILSDLNDTPITTEYSDLFQRFIGKIKDDFKDKRFTTQTIQRQPEERTEKLKEFVRNHPQDKLNDIQQSIRLKGGQDWVLMLTIDRYTNPINLEIPFAETWTLRKMMQDTNGEDKGEFYARYRLMPGPLVSAETPIILP